MFWLVSHIVHEQELKQKIVRAAADIARTVLAHTTDRRVHDCMVAVDCWLAGEQVDLRAAAKAAENAFWAADARLIKCGDDAWDVRVAECAARRAAQVTARAARAAEAAEAAEGTYVAATRAAQAAQTANAWIHAQAQHADSVRKHLPWTLIQPLLERAMQETV